MGFLKPSIEQHEVSNQASPLAEDLTGFLQQILRGGDLSAITPGTARAQEGLSEFTNALQDPGRFEELAGPLRTVNQRDTDRAAAQLREGFTQVGGRLGSPLMRAEQLLRTENQQNLDAQLANLFQQNQDLLLRGLSAQGALGLDALAPILQFASQGIQNPETVAQDSPFTRTLGAIGDITGIFNPFGE